MDLWKFKAGLVYIASSWPDRAREQSLGTITKDVG